MGAPREANPTNWMDHEEFVIYSKHEAEKITTKQFMVDHITPYQPAIFKGLIRDSPVVDTLNAEKLSEIFADQLIETLICVSEEVPCSGYLHQTSTKNYTTFDDLLLSQKESSQNEFGDIYDTRGGKKTPKRIPKFHIIDQDVPKTISDHI